MNKTKPLQLEWVVAMPTKVTKHAGQGHTRVNHSRVCVFINYTKNFCNACSMHMFLNLVRNSTNIYIYIINTSISSTSVYYKKKNPIKYCKKWQMKNIHGRNSQSKLSVIWKYLTDVENLRATKR